MRRILTALKTYRQQTTDGQDPICNKRVDAYLKKQLTIEDWIFWRRIQVEEVMCRQDSRSSKPVCPRQIKHLMGHYQRAGQELVQLWRQNMPGQKEWVFS